MKDLSYNELRLSVIVSILMDKLNLKVVDINISDELNKDTPVLMVFDKDDEGDKVQLMQCTREEAEKFTQQYQNVPEQLQ